jgi:ABC-2 type transport system permease protein
MTTMTPLPASAHLSVFPEIVRMTIRQLLGRRRTLLLLLLAALPWLLAVVFEVAGREEPEQFTRGVFDTISLTIVLPVATVLFGTGAFGAEMDEGTILYLLAKPISRWVIVLAKAFAAFILAFGLTAVSIAVAGLIVLRSQPDGGSTIEAYVVAMFVGSLAYTALFVALSLFTRRALVVGIGYSLVWEGALSSLLPGIANLSIRQYVLGISDGIIQLNREPATLTAQTGLTLAIVLIVAAYVLATARLMRFELSGTAD